MPTGVRPRSGDIIAVFVCITLVEKLEENGAANEWNPFDVTCSVPFHGRCVAPSLVSRAFPRLSFIALQLPGVRFCKLWCSHRNFSRLVSVAEHSATSHHSLSQTEIGHDVNPP